jgi:hypothetical protein
LFDDFLNRQPGHSKLSFAALRFWVFPCVHHSGDEARERQVDDVSRRALRLACESH